MNNTITIQSNIYIYLIVALYCTWFMFSLPQGGTNLPCPPLCALVDPSFAIYGCNLLLSGALFKDPCHRQTLEPCHRGFKGKDCHRQKLSQYTFSEGDQTRKSSG